MDRQTVYPGQIPLETDLLNTNRNVLTAIGALVQDIFGTNTVFTGLSVVPTVPASMSVNVNPGRCFSLQNLDNTPYSSLPANQTLQVMKQGILSTAQAFALTAPVTAGYSVNYLISAAFLEADVGATVLPYYNAAQPSVAWSGPGGTGATNTTTRQNTVSLTLTAGVPATTGTQTTPATPAGNSALYVVTVAYGQSTVTASNITQVVGSQILPGSLLSIGQQALSTSAMDTGAANAYAATYTPAIQTLSNNMTLVFEAKNADTGASTFSPNGLTAYPILGAAHSALTGGEIVAGGKVEVIWKSSANAWILLACTGGAEQISPALSAGHAVQFAQVSGVVGQARNLVMSVAAASASGTMTADEIVVETALGGLRYCLPSFNQTITLTGTGAGGMDTGAAPASGFVALYAIYNPTTKASALLATNAATKQGNVYGGANMPAGYTASALVGVWPTNASSQFVAAFQRDRRVSIIAANVLNSSAVATNQILSIASVVPPNAISVGGNAGCNNTTTSYAATIQVCGNGFGAGLKTVIGGNVSASNGGLISQFDSIDLASAQTMYYWAAISGGAAYSFSIAITNYTF